MTGLAELPLVEVQIEPHRGGRSELRVRADGRFEVQSSDHDWRPVGEYSQDELTELRDEMARANEPPLPSVIKAAAPSSHPTRMTWRLRLPDDVREVTVEDWRDGAAPPLERLYHKLFTIPRGPSVESIWRVRINEEIVERRVLGEAAAVPALEPMLTALYRRPNPFEPIGDADPPGDLLVEVDYLVDGEEGDRLAVASDGRLFLTEGGKTREVRRMNDPELANLRQAIEQTDWPALPDPVIAP